MTTAQPSGLELFSLTTIPSLDGFITGFVVQTVIGKLSSQKASIHQMNVNKHVERGGL